MANFNATDCARCTDGILALLCQYMSHISQSTPSPITDYQVLEALPHPVVAMARNYPSGHRIEPHAHIRAQLAYASQGVMRLGTAAGTFVVPPERAVWMPAGTEHWITALGALAMRTLYIKPWRMSCAPA